MGLIERLKQFYDNLTSAKKILYAGILAQLIGLGLNGIYVALSPKNRAKWEKHRELHHGDWGYLIALYGDSVNNPAIIEFGNRLRGTDRQDEKEWIFKDRKKK